MPVLLIKVHHRTLCMKNYSVKRDDEYLPVRLCLQVKQLRIATIERN
jgi:hypothetical protein